MLEMLRAHGLVAGPTQRPVPAGAIAGALADLPALAILHGFGTLEEVGTFAGAAGIAAQVACAAIAGSGYALLFQRAANDLKGGWLFGMAYGYLVWQAISVPLLQWSPPQPLLAGGPAQGLLLSHLLWGLAVGLTFPFVHRPFKSRVDSAKTSDIGEQAGARAKG